MVGQMPGTKGLDAMQHETVQDILKQGPASQAGERADKGWPAPERHRPPRHEPSKTQQRECK
ncbi:hypothetical protein RZS08_13215 [Arthrospira platensis SPKY1]|nr:hypothetical protein [Arthrospira platensis SPKY1]